MMKTSAELLPLKTEIVLPSFVSILFPHSTVFHICAALIFKSLSVSLSFLYHLLKSS